MMLVLCVYGIAMGIGIVGVLIVLIQDFEKIYAKLKENVPGIKIDEPTAKFIQILAHLLPMILALKFAPKTTKYKSGKNGSIFIYYFNSIFIIYRISWYKSEWCIFKRA